MSGQSLSIAHLNALHSAADVHELFRRLGYEAFDPHAFVDAALAEFELDEADRANVARAYIVARRDGHTVYLYEVHDLGLARLRSLGWHALQRGTALLVVTRDYREVLFVDPRFAGKPIKSSVRVNRLKVIPAEATRHDLDTLNALHAHKRTGQQVYDEQGKAFNVTTVTKRFYEDYRGHYERAKAAIKAANPGIRDFHDPDKLHAYTQRLLGRLMFLYFLQRKGWLGGRSRFLTERYLLTQKQAAGLTGSGAGESYRYYSEVLEPLFFETLNRKRPGDVTRWEGVRIPYLNGGLFDQDRDPAGPILIPDSLFDPNDANGLLGFFNRYNFTITNDTPLEQDVAVDPEMLGKVFENLLEERDRGQSGSFYTPRPIVAYMCQEALAGYLEESAALPRETTRALFDPDADASLTPDEAVRMNAALDTLTVLDPAVGSGSFLIGMLTEILRLRQAGYYALLPLTPAPSSMQAGRGEIPAEIVSNWKEAIIRDTLYGVDIKPEAIEIAQLRLWLALVVDQTLDQARPLPNLDYKLMAGNSLIETIDGEPVLTDGATALLGAAAQPVQPGLGLFETDHERRKLDELRRDYFSATPEERKRLKPDILNQERRIVTTALREKAETQEQIIARMGRLAGEGRGTLKPADARKLSAATAKLARLTDLQEALGKPDYVSPFFLYRLHFSEVFEKKNGFDIVVANPPYVRGELLGAQKDEFKVTPIYKDVYAGSADLYVYFFARGYHLLRPGGQMAYITSNKYLRANYGKGLRKFLSGNLRMNAIIDFGDLPVFDAAAYPCIVIGSRSSAPVDSIPAAAVKTMEGLEDLSAALANGVRLKPDELGESEWQIADGETQRVFAKLKAAGKPLGKFVDDRFFRGLVTGSNEAFVIGEEARQRLVSDDPKNSDVIKPWLRGRDIARWKLNSQSLYLLYIPWNFPIAQYPSLLKHLEHFKGSLSERPEVADGRYPWYALSRYGAEFVQEFEQRKIMYCDIAVKPSFALDDGNGFFSGNTTYFIPEGDLALLGVLNSTTVQFFYSNLSPQIRGGYYRFYTQYVEQIPIPNPPAELREQIAAAARACLDAAKDHPERLPALEAELNALVYQAYGLDEADIRVIEGAVGNGSSVTKDSTIADDEEVSP